jgi:hypothetical protein
MAGTTLEKHENHGFGFAPPTLLLRVDWRHASLGLQRQEVGKAETKQASAAHP